jgi:hypothetical protein
MEYTAILLHLVDFFIGTVIGGFLTYIFGVKKDKVLFQRNKRSEMYNLFVNTINQMRDLIDIEIQRIKMEYINFVNGIPTPNYSNNSKNLNEIIRLNYKISTDINDFGLLFGLKDYKVNQITDLHSSLVKLEFSIEKLLKTQNRNDNEIFQIDVLLNIIETEWKELRFHLVNIYEEAKKQYQKDLK